MRRRLLHPVVTDPSGPLATAEPHNAGIVVLNSRVGLYGRPGDVWQLPPRLARADLPVIDVRVGLRTPRGVYYLDVTNGPPSLVARSKKLFDPTGGRGGCRAWGSTG